MVIIRGEWNVCVSAATINSVIGKCGVQYINGGGLFHLMNALLDAPSIGDSI